MPAHQGRSTVSRIAGDTLHSGRIFHFSRISIFFKRVRSKIEDEGNRKFKREKKMYNHDRKTI